MKKIVQLIAVFALALSAPVLSFAAGSSGKDLCLLNSDNCPNRSLSIVEIISKLKQEIGKGTSVYSADELRTLSEKLEEYQNFYDQMQKG